MPTNLQLFNTLTVNILKLWVYFGFTSGFSGFALIDLNVLRIKEKLLVLSFFYYILNTRDSILFYNTASRSIRVKPLNYGQRKIDWGEYLIIPVGCSQMNSLLVRV